MPGRNDFGILKARALSDPRILRAAELYVERRLAREETAFAAVVGHVTMLGLWASRETDDGAIPGDGAAVVAGATLCGPGTARKIVGVLRSEGVDLITGPDGALRLRGFAEAYQPLVTRREGNAVRAQRRRDEEARRNGSVARDVTRDVDRDVTRDVTDTEGPTGASRARASAPVQACAPASARLGRAGDKPGSEPADPESHALRHASRHGSSAGLPDRTGPDLNDPPPPGQGGNVAAAARNGDGHDAPPRPLRPRERERFAKVLDYAVLRGTTAEQAMARVDREAHRRQPLDDARIAELLAGRYAWVTRQKLARWLAEGRVGWRERRAAAEQAPRRVAAHPVEQCQRHGRPMPCTTCDVATTTPADPAVAAKAIADARAALSRRPAAAPTGTTAPPPRMTEEERAAVRLAGDLAEIPEGDARHAEAAGLLGESVRDRAWAERATALLDPLEAFGGSR